MAAFTQRLLCYQVGVLLLLMATAMFAVGLATPWWAQTVSEASQAVVRHSGLWQGCSALSPDTPETCSPIDPPGWFKAVQVLQGTALVAMLAACAYAVFTNCCLDNLLYSRALEVLVAVGGVLGAVSCGLYVGKTSHVLKHSRLVGYSWAFGLDAGAAVLQLFVAAIIALSSGPPGPGDDDRANFIVEDGGGGIGGRSRSRSRSNSRSRSKSRSRSRGAVVEIEMEDQQQPGRSPARTRRLNGISGEAGRDSVIVMQNNYSSSHDQSQGKPQPSDLGLLACSCVCCSSAGGGAPSLRPCFHRDSSAPECASSNNSSKAFRCGHDPESQPLMAGFSCLPSEQNHVCRVRPYAEKQGCPHSVQHTPKALLSNCHHGCEVDTRCHKDVDSRDPEDSCLTNGCDGCVSHQGNVDTRTGPGTCQCALSCCPNAGTKDLEPCGPSASLKAATKGPYVQVPTQPSPTPRCRGGGGDEEEEEVNKSADISHHSLGSCSGCCSTSCSAPSARNCQVSYDSCRNIVSVKTCAGVREFPRAVATAPPMDEEEVEEEGTKRAMNCSQLNSSSVQGNAVCRGDSPTRQE